MGDTLDRLGNLRDQIDEIDSSILDLIEKRFKLTEQVGLYKLKSQDSVVQNGRWEELLNRLKSEAVSKGLPPELIEYIWNQIHSESIKQQNRIKESVK